MLFSIQLVAILIPPLVKWGTAVCNRLVSGHTHSYAQHLRRDPPGSRLVSGLEVANILT
jgi:hypothetical protein